MARKNKIAAELGSRIRVLRRQKKITLIELAKSTGIAQATLSRMETGIMTGTVQCHQKIAEALGISLPDLYQSLDSRRNQIRHQTAQDQRKVTTMTDLMKCELLTQHISKKKITPLLITLNHHGKSERLQLERGTEKFLLALEGSVKVTLDEDEYTLNPLDTLYFDASIPHQLSHTGTKAAKIFCAISPSKI